ncbi:hypothetical protein SAMN04488063_2136 [Halopelagius inordinatus]|uniref:Uncharacterized protein n=1 Tax=Halopelagius inordinatus TaxID=553467 RepID=A0A1I2S0X5_9EURY|nr:hypothetical protein [Halopelagius inordinatus]SFG46524.1 hypothetical protein SAMN04488063_2136 [Halopelagius inordinatus]
MSKVAGVESGEERRLSIPLEPTGTTDAVARIVDSSVATDSVVATATIVTDDPVRRVEVDWGDGETDVVTRRPGLLTRDRPAHGGDPLPDGTYQLTHAYAVSDDGRPFDHSVLLRVDDADGGVDFDVHRITLTPRYKVTHYPMTVRLKHGCDSSLEPGSEFDIRQTVGGDVVNQWEWYPSNNFFGTSQSFRLDGSGVTREFERPPLSEGGGVEAVSFEFTERDPLWDDLVRIYLYVGLDHRGYSGYFSERVEDEASGDGCTIVYSYSKEMELLVPLPAGDDPAFSGEVFA